MGRRQLDLGQFPGGTAALTAADRSSCDVDADRGLPCWLRRLGLGELPALSHAGFRNLWTAQAVSLTGTTMHNAAVLWHVAQLAGAGQRAMALGMIGLSRLIPLLGLALLGGVAADRFDRRKLMLVTQSSLAVMAALLALITLHGSVNLAWIYVLTALKGAATAFDSPTRSALMPRLVPRDHLPNAVSLNTTLFQITSLVGPALAGFTLIWLDIGWVYALNALSFLPVVVALHRLRPLQPQVVATGAKGWRAMIEGVRYVFANPLVRSSMLLDFFASFFASATTLMPIFARDVLQVGSVGFGWLCAAPSIGAVAASAILLRSEKLIQRRGELLLLAVTGYGLATIMFGMSKTLPMALLCLTSTGACDTVNMVLRNVIKQLATPDKLRGRMNGVQILFAQGGPQLGELEAGLAAQLFGAPVSVITGGLGCLLATAGIAWLSPELRQFGAPKTAIPVTPSTASAA